MMSCVLLEQARDHLQGPNRRTLRRGQEKKHTQKRAYYWDFWLPRGAGALYCALGMLARRVWLASEDRASKIQLKALLSGEVA